MGKLNDGLYPARKYRRAWVVSSGPDLQGYNGVGCYYGYSPLCRGEVFFDLRDAMAVKKSLLRYWREGSPPVEIRVVMIPRAEGRSEHVRAMEAVRDC
jgi:hypothetical protein